MEKEIEGPWTHERVPSKWTILLSCSLLLLMGVPAAGWLYIT
jgi:hypothetical protein